MGGDGCEFQGKRYAVNRSEVKDTSGAGDSFMAALCVKFLDTQDIYDSIKFANSCASEVVKHRGVTVI
jgi:sugar/nucleoside kinase (ribokinase family)